MATEGAAKRSILLRPEDWSPWVAAGLVFVVVLGVLLFVALLVLGLASGNETTTTTVTTPQVVLSPRLKQVTTCLQNAGVTTSTGDLDFVAANASGGALKARVQNNVVTISDGVTAAGGLGVVHGYRRVSTPDVIRLVRRDGRFALLWGRKPTTLQDTVVARCLR